MNSIRISPARISVAIFPPVTTVPATSDRWLLNQLSRLLESCWMLLGRTWNGPVSSQCSNSCVVRISWFVSVVDSCDTLMPTSVPAPATTPIASSRTHQVAASGCMPSRRSLAASGCSSAVTSSAPTHGSTTMRRALTSRAPA